GRRQSSSPHGCSIRANGLERRHRRILKLRRGGSCCANSTLDRRTDERVLSSLQEANGSTLVRLSQSEGLEMASIPVVSSKAPAADAIACLERAGCVVVRDLFDEDTRERLKRELAPYIDAADVGNTLNEKYAEDGLDGNFYPGNTKRITGLVVKSEMFRGFLTNPLPLAVCDALLKPNCASYHVHATAALVIGPGARVQVLHREEDPFRFVFQLPRPNMVVASMWAITDFTAANGGTLLVPGSHKWPADRKARDEEVVSAEMPAGVGFFWVGGSLPAGGADPNNDSPPS